MKKLKDGSLYFHQRDIIRPVSAGLLVAAVLAAWLAWSWVAYIIAGVVAPVALVMFFVAGSRYISDNDVAEQIEHAMQDYDKPITDMTGYERVVLKQPSPVETAAYSFSGDAIYFKKGKNSTPISDRYIGAHFFFTKDSLLVIGRKVSLSQLVGNIGDAVEDFSETFLLSGIHTEIDQHTTTVQLTNTGKKLSVKWCELVISAASTGEELLRIAVNNDVAVSDLCEAANRQTATK